MVGNFGGFQEDPVLAPQAGAGEVAGVRAQLDLDGPGAKKVTRLRVIFAAVRPQDVATIPLAAEDLHRYIFQLGGLALLVRHRPRGMDGEDRRGPGPSA